MAKRTKADGTEAVAASGTVLVEIPLGDLPPAGYESLSAAHGRLDIHITGRMSRGAAETFLRIREALRAAGEKLPGGRPVWTNADALRWILERVTEAA